MKGWPVGGKLPKVPRGELDAMTPGERMGYHLTRMHVYGARAMACAWLAGITAVAAIILAVIALVTAGLSG